MAAAVLFPKVNMDANTGRINRWLAKEGDPVREGDVLFEIESEKAAIEVEAPSSGILALAALGQSDVIKVGQAVAYICSEAEYVQVAAAEVGGAGMTASGMGCVSTASSISLSEGRVASSPLSAAVPNGHRRFSTPLARRLAAESGIDLSSIAGTGPRGRIQKKDVLAAYSGRVARQAEPSAREPYTVPAVSTGPLNAVWLKHSGKATAVLLHGFGSDLNIWRAMLGGAAFEGNVLSIDLPCHGRSPRVPPGDLDELAEQVEQTVLGMKIGHVLLGGHSLGGAVAARVASRGVIDSRSLLLFAPAGLGPKINASFLRGFLEARSQASIVPWLNELVFDSRVIPPSFVSTVERQAADIGFRAAQRILQERFFPDGTQSFSILSDLGALTIPVRIIVGTEDRILPASYVQRLSGCVSVSTFRPCGHMPQLEYRAESLRILQEMLQHAAAERGSP